MSPECVDQKPVSSAWKAATDLVISQEAKPVLSK